MYCAQCRREVKSGSAFCSACGASLRPESPPPEPAPPIQVVHVSQQSTSVYYEEHIRYTTRQRAGGSGVGCLAMILLMLCCIWGPCKSNDPGQTNTPKVEQ